MNSDQLRDIGPKKSSQKIHIHKKYRVSVNAPKNTNVDIGNRDTASHVFIERKKAKKRARTIDLTGQTKVTIHGIQPDIFGPLHRFRFHLLLRNVVILVRDIWKRLPWWSTWSIAIASLCIATILFLFIYQYQLTQATYTNYEKLFSLKSSPNLEEDIHGISADFALLRRNFQIVNIFGNNPLIRNKKIIAAHHIIDGGAELSQALNLGYGFASHVGRVVTDPGSILLTDWMQKERGTITKMRNHLIRARSAYDRIDPDVLQDQERRDIFIEKKNQLDQITNMTDHIVRNYDAWLNLLGHEQPQSVLILNQNQDELRAGGGFPGSAAMLTIYKGLPESWEMKDIYAFDWSLLTQEVPPEGINQFRASPGSSKSVDFGIRDANYYPTFEESAHKINTLLQKAGFGNVDLVIGINQSLITQILERTGPIYLPEINQFVSAQDFNVIISSLVESKTFATNSPKDILFRFAEELMQEIQSGHHTASIADILYDQLRTGEILAASTDTNNQKFLDELGIFEVWRRDTGDWIYPIFTSISKNKSDRHMQRDCVVTVSDTDMCVRTFRLHQRHAYDLQTDIEIERLYYNLGIATDLETLKHVQGKGDNNQYMRVLLPAGSMMIPAQGFDISQDVGEEFTQISWYQLTRTGSTSAVSFQYRVRDDLCAGKTWMYKQPGLERTNYRYFRPGSQMESYSF